METMNPGGERVVKRVWNLVQQSGKGFLPVAYKYILKLRLEFLSHFGDF